MHIYNGYTADGEIVASAKITVLNGVYNAFGTDGGAAIFNYGIAEIKGGTFTSVGGYSLNNQSGSVMTIDNAVVTGGIYNLGALTINDGEIATNRGGDTHAIYHDGTNLVVNGGNFTGNGNEVINANSKPATINGGTFTKVGKSSYLLAGSQMVINDGVFNAYNENGVDPAAYSVRPDVTVKGGTFNYEHKDVAEGFKVVAVEGGHIVIPATYEAVGNYKGLYKDENGVFYVYTAEGFEGLNKIFADKTAGIDAKVELMADVDMTGKPWIPVDGHYEFRTSLLSFDGNGHTISNLTVNGQAMFTRFVNYGAETTIENVTFDNANVNSNGGINTAILVVQTYNNLLLDNVDVVNSSINGGFKVAPFVGTVYNEDANSTRTATLKNCDVSNTVVKATTYDFCTTGMVAFVNAGDNDKIEFENCTVTDVQLYAPNAYTAHAAVYTTGSSTLFNEVDGVTVTNVTFENI